MNWQQEDGKLVAETDHGRYVISIKDENPRTFSVTLDSGDAIHTTMSGEYASILRATGAAQADMEHRERMWEIL